MITHLFFELHHVLIDPVALRPCYQAGVGRVMAECFGGNAATWSEAQRVIMLDWDSYYADLDLAGEDGLAHVWEGLFRTTRALFRLTHTPEPPHDALIALSRELGALAARDCDVLYGEVNDVLRQLANAGYVLGVTTQTITAYARALLAAGGVLDCFSGAIIGADVAETIRKDTDYYMAAARRAGVDPSVCLAVDRQAEALRQTKRAGMDAVMVDRQAKVEGVLPRNVLRDLRGLAGYLSSR